MGFSKWRARLPRAACAEVLRSWLTEPGSLTARCLRASSEFRVRVLHQGMARPLGDESARDVFVPVREVVLECDSVPVIFAHTTLCTAAGGRLKRWLARLGARSLGSLLFSHPGFERGRLEFLRLDARHPLYRRALGGKSEATYLWARRSRHAFGDESVLVTEVFLPEIARLK